MKSFSFYKEYYDLIILLNEKEKNELSFAIIQYMFENIEPNLNNRQMAIFNNLKRPLDKQKNKSKNSSKQKQNETKSESKQKQNEIKIETKSNQNEIKIETKQNQNEIKSKTHINGNGNVYGNVNDNNNNNSFSYCEEQFKRTLSPAEYDLIALWQEWFKDDDIINYAIEKTVINGARTLNYTEKIINSWHDKGYKTLNDCKQEEAYRKPKESMPEAWKDIKPKEASYEEIKELEAVINEFN